MTDSIAANEGRHKQICMHCDGTNQITVTQMTRSKEKGIPCLVPETPEDVPCLASGTPEEIWGNIEFLLAQFIRCNADGQFDTDNPLKTKCEGCAHDRGEVFDQIRHYGEAVSQQNKPEEIWKKIEFLLAVFIRCKADGPFNRDNPTQTKCEGCAYEREEILSHVWHWSQAILQQS